MSPLIQDVGSQKFKQLLALEDWEKISRASIASMMRDIFERARPSNDVLIGNDAQEYLANIICHVQKYIINEHCAYGPIRWMWYIRRSPGILFSGNLGTTFAYDRGLAEAISAQFTAADVGEHLCSISFAVDRFTFRHVVRYASRIKALSHLHVLYRLVGKGAVLNVKSPLFFTEENQSISHAVKIYDARHDQMRKFIGSGLGLAIDGISIDEKPQWSEETDALLSMPCTPFLLQIKHPNEGGELIDVKVLAHFSLCHIKIDKIIRPLGRKAGFLPILKRAAAIIQLLMLVPAFLSNLPYALGAILQFGYFFITTKRLQEIFEAHSEDIVSKLRKYVPEFHWADNFLQWHNHLTSVKASPWPLSAGNFLRAQGDMCLIDISGATSALLHSPEAHRSSDLSNLRGEVFESQCQDLIDATVWAPPAEQRALRGRQLRQNGSYLTDIDAIGVKDRTLLLISCKSIIYDREYDQGVFHVIRNARSTVDEAVISWAAVIQKLTSQSQGDNFDFSEFDEIIGVVCTPFVVYSEAELTLAFIKSNLRACSSMDELWVWLSKEECDIQD